jgi:hypothetical protein
VYISSLSLLDKTQPISLDDGEDISPELLPDSNRPWERIFEDLDTHIYTTRERKRDRKCRRSAKLGVWIRCVLEKETLDVQEVGGLHKKVV